MEELEDSIDMLMNAIRVELTPNMEKSMTTMHQSRWFTPDLLEVQAVSLPQDFEMRQKNHGA